MVDTVQILAPEEIVWDDRVEGWHFASMGDESIWITPMIFNHRIVIGPSTADWYAHGWCYESALAAVVACSIWDPFTEDEPVGYIKRATPGHRRAPQNEERRSAR